MKLKTMTLEEFEEYSTVDYNYYNGRCPKCKSGHVNFRNFSNVISIDGKYFRIFYGTCNDCFTLVYLKQYNTKAVMTPVLDIDEQIRGFSVEREVPCGDKSGFVYVVSSDASISFKYKGEYCRVDSYEQSQF